MKSVIWGGLCFAVCLACFILNPTTITTVCVIATAFTFGFDVGNKI